MALGNTDYITVDCGFLGEQRLAFVKRSYAHGDGIAIEAYTEDGEPWATISVNLPQDTASEGCIFCDTNNCTSIIDSLVESGYLELTGLAGVSGFCVYPEAKLTAKFESVLSAF